MFCNCCWTRILTTFIEVFHGLLLATLLFTVHKYFFPTLHKTVHFFPKSNCLRWKFPRCMHSTDFSLLMNSKLTCSVKACFTWCCKMLNLDSWQNKSTVAPQHEEQKPVVWPNNVVSLKNRGFLQSGAVNSKGSRVPAGQCGVEKIPTCRNTLFCKQSNWIALVATRSSRQPLI